MRNLLFVLFLIVVSCSRDPCGIRTAAVEDAIYEMSDKFSIPSSLLKGIRWAESANGTLTNRDYKGRVWVWSDSRATVLKEDWVKNFRDPTTGENIKQLERRYGREVFWCVGDFQVLWLCARLDGYTNSPYALGIDINKNCYYGSKLLRYNIDRYGGMVNVKRAISAYNAGHWVHYNKEYVMRVWAVYSNLFPGNYYEQ